MLKGNPINEYRLPEPSGGLNLRDLEFMITTDQSPDMLNMWYRDRVLSKRWGQEYVDFTDAGGQAVTFQGIRSISPDYAGYIAIHDKTTLFKVDLAQKKAYAIATVADNGGQFLEFNGVMYHMDGAKIRQISAAYEVSEVEPYKPIVYINCLPGLGASTPNEAYNLTGAGFRVWYNGDGATAAYKFPVDGLDATPISVRVSETVQNPVTDYIWNAATGTLTFQTGHIPAKGTNNVEVTAYKTVTGAKEKILKCKIAIAFGGESTDISGGTRAFVMGNPDYPYTYWYSELGAGKV